MLQVSYPARLVPAKEGGFIVTFPGLPVFTEGETEGEALKNAEEALLCHFEGIAKEHGDLEPGARAVVVHVKVPEDLEELEMHQNADILRKRLEESAQSGVSNLVI